MNERRYCSLDNTDEPLAGTADHVDVWLLLEYRPTWPARVQRDNQLSEPVRLWLDRALEELRQAGFRPRLQFIRQPETDRADTRLLIGVHERLLEIAGSGYGFLEDVSILDVIGNHEAFATLREPRYFVCTNGQRDLCCARFGLPAYQALRERVGDRVWQATHLGGHRFAPNVLVFPAGVLYGRVDADRVPEFLSHIEAAAIDFPRLRGRCRYPAAVQAAEARIAQPGLKLLQVDGDDSEARVTFTSGHDLSEVTVRRSDEPLTVIKSCGEESADVYPYYCV